VKIEPASGFGSILAFKTDQELNEWLDAMDGIAKRLSAPVASTEEDVVEGEQQEKQWSQMLRFQKQEKRVTRYLSHIETLENKLALEIAARQALEQHVRGLMQRIDALEQKANGSPAPTASPDL